jgi:hypothetical protein
MRFERLVLFLFAMVVPMAYVAVVVLTPDAPERAQVPTIIAGGVVLMLQFASVITLRRGM